MERDLFEKLQLFSKEDIPGTNLMRSLSVKEICEFGYRRPLYKLLKDPETLSPQEKIEKMKAEGKAVGLGV